MHQQIEEIPELEIPEDIICPITSQIMTEPVVLVASGNTYEHEAILKWLEKHDTDPYTNQKIEDKTIISNRTIKRLISSFLDKHKKTNAKLIHETYLPESLIQTLITALRVNDLKSFTEILNKDNRLLNQVLKDNKNILWLACESASLEILDFLFVKFDYNIKKFPGIENNAEFPLFLSVSRRLGIDGAARMTRALQWQPIDIQNLLKLSIVNNDIDSVKVALSLGAIATPELLEHAYENRTTEIVKALLLAGASINAKDNLDNGFFIRTLEDNYTELILFLILNLTDKINLYHSSKLQDRVLNISYKNCQKGDFELLNVLISKNIRIEPILFKAIQNHQYELTEILLTQAIQVINLQATDELGCTALHLAVANNDLNLVKILLDKGANNAALNLEGNSPLHLAAAGNLEEMAIFLIEKNVPFKIKNIKKQTPLDLAKNYGYFALSQKMQETYRNRKLAPVVLPLNKRIIELEKQIRDQHEQINVSNQKIAFQEKQLSDYREETARKRSFLEKMTFFKFEAQEQAKDDENQQYLRDNNKYSNSFYYSGNHNRHFKPEIRPLVLPDGRIVNNVMDQSVQALKTWECLTGECVSNFCLEGEILSTLPNGKIILFVKGKKNSNWHENENRFHIKIFDPINNQYTYLPDEYYNKKPQVIASLDGNIVIHTNNSFMYFVFENGQWQRLGLIENVKGEYQEIKQIHALPERKLIVLVETRYSNGIYYEVRLYDNSVNQGDMRQLWVSRDINYQLRSMTISTDGKVLVYGVLSRKDSYNSPERKEYKSTVFDSCDRFGSYELKIDDNYQFQIYSDKIFATSCSYIRENSYSNEGKYKYKGEILDVETGQKIENINDIFSFLSILPDGKIATISYNPNDKDNKSSIIIIRDKHLNKLFKLKGLTERINSLTTLSDGKLVGAGDNAIKIWDPSNGQCLLSIPVSKKHHKRIVSIVALPGEKFAIVKEDSIKIWQLKSSYVLPLDNQIRDTIQNNLDCRMM